MRLKGLLRKRVYDFLVILKKSLPTLLVFSRQLNFNHLPKSKSFIIGILFINLFSLDNVINIKELMLLINKKLH